ncbi:C4-dicarboxylate transporter DctA [Phenylobacterium sp.]|uniref:C4-dicarboxylate transporter DctA n=1 Tax=Phenylobacterium sp. TaxID=1871053 RepID=UPI00271F4327|nr:C4-dicarboxylate transporter DctA [Phenylobacterium sp.]MDO8380708.1 C4-dicarboxylate transporter DctA [Phenylobacterium sp.]
MRLIGQLWVQVLAATVAGALLGHFHPELGAAMKPLGDAFIALVKMIIPPVIFCTVVHGVAGMGDFAKVGRVAGKALAYFLGVTLLALVFAMTAANVLQPGAGMNIDPAALDTGLVADYAKQAEGQTVAQFLTGIIPTTFVSAFTQPNVLQVLFVALLFAFALALTGERGRPVLDLIERVSEVFFNVVGFIMRVAPIGAFGAMAFAVGKFGSSALLSLGTLVLEFWAICLVFVFGVMGAIAWAAGVNILKLLAYLKDEIAIVAGSGSTEVVLPRVMQRLKDLGCDEGVVGLVVPTGYSFNLDGTCLYLATAAIFLAQATNTPMTLAQQAGMIGVMMLTSKGAAAVPGAAFVALAATLGTVGHIPVAAIALILGVHKLLAEALTFVNLVGNTLASIVVCKWEGAIDQSVMDAQIGFSPRLEISK